MSYQWMDFYLLVFFNYSFNNEIEQFFEMKKKNLDAFFYHVGNFLGKPRAKENLHYYFCCNESWVMQIKTKRNKLKVLSENSIGLSTN